MNKRTAGIVIDDWKLEIFERHLNAGGYKFKKENFVNRTISLIVEYTERSHLKTIVEKANAECEELKAKVRH